MCVHLEIRLTDVGLGRSAVKGVLTWTTDIPGTATLGFKQAPMVRVTEPKSAVRTYLNARLYYKENVGLLLNKVYPIDSKLQYSRPLFGVFDLLL